MTTLANRNERTGMLAAALALAMVGLGFAAVPLYRIFCERTGFGGTTQRATEAALPQQVTGKVVAIRFDSNVSPDLPWRFEPEQRTDRAAIGARKMAFFTARNDGKVAITGSARFNVQPEQAGKYFTKVQCFCFNEQTLQPGQQIRMPVVYFVDPAILKDEDARDINEITLSYTFYPAAGVPSGTAGKSQENQSQVRSTRG